MKYLGIIFSSKNNFILHVNKLINKVYGCTKSLYNALRWNNQLCPKIKILCYKQLIRPAIVYAFPIWSSISSAQMERLRRLERKILRQCINYERKANGYHFNINYLYNKSKIIRLDQYMLNLAYQYFDRLSSSSNPLMQAANDIPDDLIRAVRTKPPGFLNILRSENIIIPLYNRGKYNSNIRVYK